MLTTQHLDDPDITKAAAELSNNVRRLVISGSFVEAHQALKRLVEEGPWKVKRHGRLHQQLESLFPTVCFLAGKSSPNIGDQPAMAVSELAEWAADRGERAIDDLAMQALHQTKAAGGQWSESYLSNLAAEVDRHKRLRAFGQFCGDAEIVLKARLSEGRPAKFLGIDIDEIEAALKEASLDPATREMLEAMGGREMLSKGAAPAEVAEPARRVTTMRIAHAVADYLAATGDGPGYLPSFIYRAAAVLRVRDGHPRDAAVCAAYLLALGDEELQSLVRLALWPPMAEACRAGHFASVVGVERAAVATYLAAIESRPRMQKTAKQRSQAGSQDTLASFAAEVADSPLKEKKLVALPILDTGEQAYAFALTAKELEPTWRAARSLVDKTGRWPVAALMWGAGSTPTERLEQADFFSRFYFEEAPDCDDVSPRGLIAAADSVDVDAFIARKRADQYETDWSLDGMLEFHLDATRRWTGNAPTPHDVRKARLNGRPITTDLMLERWLLEWELTQKSCGDPNDMRARWFENDNLAMLFLPIIQPWDALAYISMFGNSDYGAEHYIALGRRWHRRYSAELVSHYGTMLQCFVTRPPVDVREAFELSAEHLLLAPCTFHLSGTTLRHHAAGLVGYDRWFFHERP